MLVFKNGEQAAVKWTPLFLPDAANLDLAAAASALTPGLTPAWGHESTAAAMEALPHTGGHAELRTRHTDFATLDEEPASIIERARAEAGEIIADARARVADIERDARDKAAADARANIAAETAAAIDPLRLQLAQSLAETAGLREQIAAYAERELVQLALEIAKKVVRREVTVDREIVISLARVALARLHNRALATVHLHPDDFEFVAAHRDRLGGGNTVQLVEDSTIGRGGCFIETDLGDIDARIEQQFGEIERGFLEPE
jgi:flagellar assembly protein FliH